MDSKDRDQRLADWLDGELPDDEAARLLAELQGDPEFRAGAAKGVLVRRLLDSRSVPEGNFAGQVVGVLREDDNDALTSQVITRLQGHRSRRRKLAWSIGALASAALVVFGFFLLTRSEPSPGSGIRIVAAEGVGTLNTAAILDGRVIRIESGLLELDLNSDARIVLEAPAKFQVRSPVHVVLHEGRCFAEMEKGKSGLRIETPSGEVLDLGTKFAIEVSSPDETQVHVFDGEVEVSDRRSKRRIRKGEGLVFRSSGEQETLTAAPELFVPRVPQGADRSAPFVHWPFDEGSGRTVAPQESQVGAGNLMAERNSTGPSWVEGVFGEALQFSGAGEWVETDHPGVSGSRDRTVACWMKLPSDWGLGDRGPMISWGSPDRKQTGRGWRFAVTRGSKGHPERTGRLALTLGNRWVVGTTDLRDGRWHHVAAVALGGEGIPTFLFYVDGQLEVVSRNTVELMETETEESAQTVRFGHQHYQDRQTLRGSLDEVYLFETALSGDQIRAVMRNEPVFGDGDQ